MLGLVLDREVFFRSVRKAVLVLELLRTKAVMREMSARKTMPDMVYSTKHRLAAQSRVRETHPYIHFLSRPSRPVKIGLHNYGFLT